MSSWDDIERKSLVKNIPLRAMIEMTYACNFQCTYCYLDEKRKSPVRLTREACSVIFKKLRAAGCLAVTFTGGELFLLDDMLDILTDARNNRFAVRLFTNGSMITPEVVKALKVIQPLSVDVSLYGASEASYRQVTGKSNYFRRVVDNIKLLTDAGVATVIKIVVNKTNYSEIDAMLALATSLGCEPVVTPLITPSDCGDRSPCSQMLDDEALLEYFKRHAPPQQQPAVDPEGIICTTGRNALVISPTGDVFPCIQVREVIGNILSDDLQDIWHAHPHPLLEELRALHPVDMDGCNGCQSAQYCFTCPGLNKIAGGTFISKDPATCRIADIRKKAGGSF